MPLPRVKRDELRVLHARDGLGARVALLGEQKPVAEDAVGGALDGRELVPADGRAAVRALEALAVPGTARVHDARLGDGSVALGALLAVLQDDMKDKLWSFVLRHRSLP